MQLWTISEVATGNVLYAGFVTPSYGSHPKDNGWPWDAATQKATRIDAAPDVGLQRWNGSAWVEDAAKVEAGLLALLKAEAERRKMTFLSAGGAKKAEYAQKAAEVAFWDSLGGTVTAIVAAFNLLPASARQAKFGYALADAAAFGDTVQDAIARFRAGMTSSQKVPSIAAVEAKGCAAIKAATTAAAKRAAATAVNWPA